jgi:hypothetical protein
VDIVHLVQFTNHHMMVPLLIVHAQKALAYGDMNDVRQTHIFSLSQTPCIEVLGSTSLHWPHLHDSALDFLKTS